MLVVFLVAYLAGAVASDASTRRIPNWLTLGGAAVALVVRISVGGAASFESGVVGALIAGAVGLVFWLGRTIGGGDHKLLIGVGAFAGRELVAAALLGAGLAGGILSLFWLIFLRFRIVKTKRMPYSIAIAAGALCAPLLSRVIFH